MAYLKEYDFYNLSRLDDDPCVLTEKERQNQGYSNYLTTNYFVHNCGMKEPTRVATQQPSVFIGSAPFSNVGLGGCNVNTDSQLRIQKVQTNPKGPIDLFARPFLTVPYLGRGAVDPVQESYIQQGDIVSNRKSCNTTSEVSYVPYHHTPMLHHLKHSIQNPQHLVEEEADEGWIRGGLPSRDWIKQRQTLMK